MTVDEFGHPVPESEFDDMASAIIGQPDDVLLNYVVRVNEVSEALQVFMSGYNPK